MRKYSFIAVIGREKRVDSLVTHGGLRPVLSSQRQIDRCFLLPTRFRDIRAPSDGKVCAQPRIGLATEKESLDEKLSSLRFRPTFQLIANIFRVYRHWPLVQIRIISMKKCMYVLTLALYNRIKIRRSLLEVIRVARRICVRATFPHFYRFCRCVIFIHIDRALIIGWVKVIVVPTRFYRLAGPFANFLPRVTQVCVARSFA